MGSINHFLDPLSIWEVFVKHYFKSSWGFGKGSYRHKLDLKISPKAFVMWEYFIFLLLSLVLLFLCFSSCRYRDWEIVLFSNTEDNGSFLFKSLFFSSSLFSWILSYVWRRGYVESLILCLEVSLTKSSFHAFSNF